MREILYHPPTRKHTIQCHHPIRKYTIQCHHPIRKHTIQYHNPIRKVVMIIHYKYKVTPSVKGTHVIRPPPPLKAVNLSLSQKEIDLGIRAATGEALADPPYFLFLQRRATSRACIPTLQQSYFSPDDSGACRPARHRFRSGPTTPSFFSPVPVEKKHHQV